jgi:hypothetical protein
MNGRQAKKLRRAALGMAIQLDSEGKDIKKAGYTVKVHRDLSPHSTFPELAGVSSNPADERKPQPKPIKYTVSVRPDSLKGIYKQLKRAS